MQVVCFSNLTAYQIHVPAHDNGICHLLQIRKFYPMSMGSRALHCFLYICLEIYNQAQVRPDVENGHGSLRKKVCSRCSFHIVFQVHVQEKEHLEQTFLRKDPLAILYVRSHLCLVVNLQTNVKAMQSPAYAHRVKLSNLQQMANTIIYVQEHGFDTQSDLKNTLLASKQELKEMQTQVAQHRSNLRILNDQIRYTGQYYANKEVYSQFSKSKYKGKYRKEHAKEIQKYEEARNWLRSFYQDGKMTSLKALTLQKEKLQQQIASEEEAISSLKEKLKDLDTADQNVDAILQMQIPEAVEIKTKDSER